MEDHSHKKCHEENTEKELSFVNSLKQKGQNYKPLIVILIFCLFLPLTRNDLSSQHYMYAFMGYFFIFLSLFKFFNLEGFVEGFSTYDLITKRFRAYGYGYPFVEFLLGAAYLSKFGLLLVNWITVIIMVVSGIGVLKSILSGQKIKCACLGTVLDVPLSTISILENFGMGAMAFWMAVSASY